MNVYTHVAMDDLATDVESLPPVLGSAVAQKPQRVPPQLAAAQSHTVTLPPELAALTSSWADLPEHICQVIATLAGA